MRKLLYLFALTVTLSCKQEDPTPPPVADFTLTELDNGLVDIRNYSQNATRYSWDFGDGRTSSDEEPFAIKYKYNGPVDITLTADNGRGGVDKATKSIYVRTAIKVGEVTFWTNFNSAPIDIFIEGKQIGTSTRYITQGSGPECFQEGFASVQLSPGTYNFTAQSRDAQPLRWTGTVQALLGSCTKMQLTK